MCEACVSFEIFLVYSCDLCGHFKYNKMGCFNDPAWEKVCGWVGGGVADTNYLYQARWINICVAFIEERLV